MNRLIIAIVFLLTLILDSTASMAADTTCVGTWNTTNRKLDGTMTCVVTEMGAEQWRGRFYGVWQGVAFDYTVPFSGPPSDLRGTAQIDGADYTWKGQITKGSPGDFKGTFGGTRYYGSFDLKEKYRGPH
jgi:hypothetical protein